MSSVRPNLPELPQGPSPWWTNARGEKLPIHAMTTLHLHNSINMMCRKAAAKYLGGTQMVFRDNRTQVGVHFPYPPLEEVLKMYPQFLWLMDELALRKHPGYAKRQEQFERQGGHHAYTHSEAERENHTRGQTRKVPRYRAPKDTSS